MKILHSHVSECLWHGTTYKVMALESKTNWYVYLYLLGYENPIVANYKVPKRRVKIVADAVAAAMEDNKDYLF